MKFRQIATALGIADVDILTLGFLKKTCLEWLNSRFLPVREAERRGIVVDDVSYCLLPAPCEEDGLVVADCREDSRLLDVEVKALLGVIDGLGLPDDFVVWH
jgi:hypothetical protein